MSERSGRVRGLFCQNGGISPSPPTRVPTIYSIRTVILTGILGKSRSRGGVGTVVAFPIWHITVCLPFLADGRRF
jgi:hypothetical protein